jgi:hypothetical protein
VVVLADPLERGVGAVREVTRGGKVLVEFEPADDAPYGVRGPFGVFDAHELELLDRWISVS